MLFGLGILLILGVLATVFGVGHVEEKTSYGLMPIITTLSTLAGAFAQWAFGQWREEKPKPPEPPV
jgi:hypothetical protein